MLEERLIELETRIAYQEATIQDLNDALAAQQRRLGELEQLCRQLGERVIRIGQDIQKGSAADEIPPHY